MLKSIFEYSHEENSNDVIINTNSLTAIELEENQEDLVNIELEINNSLEELENLQAIHTKLEEQSETNEELIQKAIENALAEDVKNSQECLQYCITKLNLPISEFKVIQISIESFDTPYHALLVSQESILSLLKNIGEKIVDTFMELGRLVYNFSIRCRNSLGNKANLLTELERIVKDNPDTEVLPLEVKQVNSITKKLDVILSINKGNFNFDKHIEFVNSLSGNPILNKVKLFYSSVMDPDNNESERKSLSRELIQDNNKSEESKKILDFISKDKDNKLKYQPVSVVSCIGRKVALVCNTIDKQGNEVSTWRDNLSLGFVINTYTKPNEGGLGFINLDHISTLKDFLPIIKELKYLTSNANSFFNNMLDSNKEAVRHIQELTKDASDKIKLENLKRVINKIKTAYDKVVDGLKQEHQLTDVSINNEDNKLIKNHISKGLNILNSIGNTMVYDMMSNYYHNTNVMIQIVEYHVRKTKVGRTFE